MNAARIICSAAGQHLGALASRRHREVMELASETLALPGRETREIQIIATFVPPERICALPRPVASGVPPDVEGVRLAARNQRTNFLRRTNSPAPIRCPRFFPPGETPRLYGKRDARRHALHARLKSEVVIY